jgi:hypothetical protein
MMICQFRRVMLVVLSLIVLVCTSVWSQEEADHEIEWLGELERDGVPHRFVTFDVRQNNGDYKILSFREKGTDDDNPVTDFLWGKEDIIYFTWNPGMPVRCKLHKIDEKKYAGECNFSDSDTPYTITVSTKGK